MNPLMPQTTQKYIVNSENKLLDASIIAAHTSESSYPPEIINIKKRGNGDFSAVGNYLGDTDKSYRIIVNAEAPSDESNLYKTAPVFVGVGGGELNVIHAKDLPTQEIKVICTDAGKASSKAKIILYGMEFQAVVDGTAGNAVELSVDMSDINSASGKFDTGRTTPTHLSPGTVEIPADFKDLWDNVNFTYLENNDSGGITAHAKKLFTEVTLENVSAIAWSVDNPIACSRFMFEADPFTIYSFWKIYDGQDYTLFLSEPIKGFIPKGSTIYYITGTRTVTATLGESSLAYENITSIADFFNALTADNTDADGNDNRIIKPALDTLPETDEIRYNLIDFNVVTDAHYIPPVMTSENEKWGGITVNSLSATLQYSIVMDFSVMADGDTNAWVCDWQAYPQINGLDIVSGSLELRYGESATISLPETDFSGDLEEVINFTLNNAGAEIDGNNSGDVNDYMGWHYKFYPVARDQVPVEGQEGGEGEEGEEGGETTAIEYEDAPPTQFCFYARLGINAQASTFEFIYTKRFDECECPPFYFDPDCLGLDDDFIPEGYNAFLERFLEYWGFLEDGYEVVLFESNANSMEPAYAQSLVYDDMYDSIVGSYIYVPCYLAASYIDNPVLNSKTRPLLVEMYSTLFGILDNLYLQMHTWTVAPPLPMIHAGNFNYYWRPDTKTFEKGEETTIPHTLLPRLKTDQSLLDYLWRLINEYQDIISAIAEDECYEEDPSAGYFWTVEKTSSNPPKKYCKAYTGIPYYSHIQCGENRLNTMEFAVLIDNPCSMTFQEGDKIIFTIYGENPNDIDIDGDTTIAFLVNGTQAKKLSNGSDGTNTYTFECRYEKLNGSNVVREFNVGYDDTEDGVDVIMKEIEFNLKPYTSPRFVRGDYFKFNMEGGVWSYSEVDGNIYSRRDINQRAVLFAPGGSNTGISTLFDFNVFQNFYVGDEWLMLLKQSNKTYNMTAIDGNDIFMGILPIVIDLNEIPAEGSGIDTILIHRHNFSATDKIKLEYSDDNFVSDINAVTGLNGAAIGSGDTFLFCFTEIYGYRYWRLSATDAGGSAIASAISIGFLFLGQHISVSHEAKVEERLRWNMLKNNARSRHNLLEYQRTGVAVNYSDGRFLRQTGYEKIRDILKYIKSNNDESIFFVPYESRSNQLDRQIIKGKIENDLLEPASPIPINSPSTQRTYKCTFTIYGDE